MELFSLLAKLTLDAKEYYKDIQSIEQQKISTQDIEAELTLNDIDFNTKMEEAQAEEVGNKDSELTLEDESFRTDMAADQAEEVENQDPTLTLDDEDFVTSIHADQAEEVENQDVALTLDDESFRDDIAEDQAETVDDLNPSLTLTDDGYSSTLEQAQADTESWSGAVGDIFENLKGVVAATGIAVVASGIVSSLSEAVDLARSTGDSIDKTSRAMSISTDAYQEWSHMLDINGASITDLNRGLMSMRKLVGGGEVTKDAAAAFESLGLSAKVANGEITNTEDLMMATLKALADFQGDAAERDVLAQAIFGRGGTKLNALFDGTSKDMDFLINQAHELGLVMSEEEISNAAAYNDAVTNMKASIDAFKTSLVTDFLPVLTEAANTVAKIVAFLNPRTNNKTLSETLMGKDEEFLDEIATIEGTADAASNLADKLLAMGDTSKMTADQYAIWKGVAEELIQMVPSLGEVIDTESGQIKANSDEIKENIRQWEILAKQKALQTVKDEKYNAIAKRNAELIDQSVQAEVNLAKAQAKRAQAAQSLNDLIDQFGLGEEWFLAENASDSDIARIGTRLSMMANYDPEKMRQVSAVMEQFGEWTNMNRDVEEARAEVEKIAKEVEEAKQEYEDWLAAAEKLFGTEKSDAEDAKDSVDDLNQSLNNLPNEKHINLIVDDGRSAYYYHAAGQWNVPTDDYPALLHREKMVLNASRAREYREGGRDGIDYARLEDAIISSIRKGMDGATVNSYLDGRSITDAVSRELAGQLQGRRFG